jgi:hypothetical protein
MTDPLTPKEVRFRVRVDALGDLSDGEGATVARATAVTGIKAALSAATAEIGLTPPDAIDQYKADLAARLEIRSIERGSLTVMVGIDQATVLWIVQQLWPGLADTGLVGIVAIVLHNLRHFHHPTAKPLPPPELPEQLSGRIVRVSLEYEDGTRLTWDSRSLHRQQTKGRPLARRRTADKATTRGRRKGRRGRKQ